MLLCTQVKGNDESYSNYFDNFNVEDKLMSLFELIERRDLFLSKLCEDCYFDAETDEAVSELERLEEEIASRLSD